MKEKFKKNFFSNPGAYPDFFFLCILAKKIAENRKIVDSRSKSIFLDFEQKKSFENDFYRLFSYEKRLLFLDILDSCHKIMVLLHIIQIQMQYLIFTHSHTPNACKTIYSISFSVLLYR